MEQGNFSAAEQRAEQLVQKYPDPRALALAYYELDERATALQNQLAQLGVDEDSPTEQERQELFSALEALDDPDYTAKLVDGLFKIGYTRDEALLLMGAYVERGSWTLEKAAPSLWPWLEPANTTGLRHSRALAAEVIYLFGANERGRHGEEAGNRRALEEVRPLQLPEWCLTNPNLGYTDEGNGSAS